MKAVRPKDSVTMASLYVVTVLLTIVIPQSLSLHRVVGTDLYFAWVVYFSSFMLIYLGVLGGLRSTIINLVLLILAATLTYMLYPKTYTVEIDTELAVLEWPSKITLAYMCALLNQMRTWINKKK